METDWFVNLPIAVTVCDRVGVIIQMNEKAIKTFESSGGAALIGKNVYDCHPEPSKTKLRNLMETGQKNIYTIEKNGVKKLIYQTPWYKNGLYSGFLELSMEVSLDMPHFVRESLNE